MDYSSPSDEQAAVAIVKYPSKIPPGQAGYLGPILFNPGFVFSICLICILLLSLRKVDQEGPVFRWCLAVRRPSSKYSETIST